MESFDNTWKVQGTYQGKIKVVLAPIGDGDDESENQMTEMYHIGNSFLRNKSQRQN